jgi:hypothetical protein
MNSLQKLMAKKKSEGKKLSGAEKKGKEDTLQSLIDDMMGMDGEKVKGMKKVTVASNSPKGLSKGLDKAKELIGDAPTGGLEDGEEEMSEGEEMMEEEMPEGESEESPEMEEESVESEEESSESPEELEAEIEKLKEKLAKLKK